VSKIIGAILVKLVEGSVALLEAAVFCIDMIALSAKAKESLIVVVAGRQEE